jgi:hypothetical protein
MLEYLADNPLPEDILAAVYLKPEKQPGRNRKRNSPKSTEAALAQMTGVSAALGSGLSSASKLPPELREMAMWAIDQQKKLNKLPN